MAWYEVAGPSRMGFVVGQKEVAWYRDRPSQYTVRSLVFAPRLEETDIDILAEVIHLGDDWYTLEDEDKDFARESAEEILSKYRIFPIE